MAKGQVMTPTYEVMRDLADRAQSSIEGIGVKFVVGPQYEDLGECLKAARRFQMTFAGMRARARDAARNRRDKTDPSTGFEVKGPYDDLAAIRSEVSGGVMIKLIKATSIDFAFDVVDLKDDTPLGEFNVEVKQVEALLRFFIARRQEWVRKHEPGERFTNPLSEDEEKFFWKHLGDQGIEMYPACGLDIPPWVDVGDIRFIGADGKWWTGEDHLKHLGLTHPSVEDKVVKLKVKVPRPEPEQVGESEYLGYVIPKGNDINDLDPDENPFG